MLSMLFSHLLHDNFTFSSVSFRCSDKSFFGCRGCCKRVFGGRKRIINHPHVDRTDPGLARTDSQTQGPRTRIARDP
jgi:hypothetical protein